MTDVSYKKILEKAKACHNNVKKNYKNGISSKWGYYIGKSILKPKTDIKKISIGDAPNPNGEKINKTVNKADYLTIIKKYVKFIEDHHRLPNHVTVLGVKVSPRLFTAFLSFILVKGKPAKQAIKSSIYNKPKAKYGRSTKQGCDNRGQNNGHNCGPHMVQEIIRNLTGKVIPQKTLAAVMGTTTSGTDHQGINTGFAWFNKKYGYNLKVEWKNFSDLGWKGIKKILESDNQDCGLHELYRDKWGHYTNYDKVYDNTVDVHNSLGDSCSHGCYCGYTENRSKTDARRYLAGISQKSVLVVTKA